MKCRSMAAPISIPVTVLVAERVLRRPSTPSLSKYCSYASFPFRAIITLVMDLNSPALMACSICARRSVESPPAEAGIAGQSFAVCAKAAAVRTNKTVVIVVVGNILLDDMLVGRVSRHFALLG